MLPSHWHIDSCYYLTFRSRAATISLSGRELLPSHYQVEPTAAMENVLNAGLKLQLQKGNLLEKISYEYDVKKGRDHKRLIKNLEKIVDADVAKIVDPDVAKIVDPDVENEKSQDVKRDPTRSKKYPKIRITKKAEVRHFEHEKGKVTQKEDELKTNLATNPDRCNVVKENTSEPSEQ